MPTLIELMYDQSVAVRDTAAWTFGRICEIIPGAAINETYLKPLLESLYNGLKAEPRVAANVCWAFTGLAEASYEAAEATDDNNQPETYCMSSYFNYIIDRLLETTDRADGAQANLRSAAYEALMEMVKNSPKDCYATVQRTTLVRFRPENRLGKSNKKDLNMKHLFPGYLGTFATSLANGEPHTKQFRPCAIQRPPISVVRNSAIRVASSDARRRSKDFRRDHGCLDLHVQFQLLQVWQCPRRRSHGCFHARRRPWF